MTVIINETAKNPVVVIPANENVSQLEKMSFRTYVRNLRTLKSLDARFLVSLRNDKKSKHEIVS